MEWNSLAAELRDMILEALAREDNVGHCASVCREWQAAIEPRNFQSLRLTAQDISELNMLTSSKIDFVKYIRYHIELRDYDCTECELSETVRSLYASRATIEHALRLIFCALSERRLDGTMTLDISIHSPSDSQHHFPYIRFEPANALGSQDRHELALHTNPVHKAATSAPFRNAISRLFLDIELGSKDSFWASMPPAPCVTSLLLRRQTRRRWIGYPMLPSLGQLMALLPNVQDVCYEAWRE